MTFVPLSKREAEPGKRNDPVAGAPSTESGSPRYVQAMMRGSAALDGAVTAGSAHDAAADTGGIHRYLRSGSAAPGPRPAIQRSPDGRTTAGPSTPAVDAALHDRSPGQPLAAPVAGVRIHTDAHANGLARDLGAHAFTRGSDIYFARGRFQPGTAEGQRLITHELVHVAQNARGGPVREGVSQPTDASEREADAVSRSPDGDASRAVVTAGPSAALSRDPDDDLSTRVAAFKRLVLTTAQHRLLDNRENLSKWRTYIEDKIPLDEFKRELVATETVQTMHNLGAYSDTYFTTENPSMQAYLGSVAAGDQCLSCHGLMRAQADQRRTTTIAERVVEYGGDETGLAPLHQRVATNMYLGSPQPSDTLAYVRAYYGAGGGDATAQPATRFSPSEMSLLFEDRAPLTIDQRSALMKRMHKTIAKLKPILGVLGPDGFQVLPALVGIGDRIDQTPAQIMGVRQSVIDAIETRRGQYLTLYGQIDHGDIEWMHFGPILQDLLPIADADVQAQIKDELAAWERRQALKAIFTLGVSLMLLLLTIFPPTSALGVAALAAFEVGWGAYMIQEGQAQWSLGSAYGNAVGATNVLSKEQAAAGTGMMFMGALQVVGGIFTGAGGFARAAGIPNMPLSAFGPRATPTLVAGTRTLQFGEFTVSVEANGTIVVTHAASPDLLVIIRNGEAQLFQSMGPGGMRLIETRPFPMGQVGPEALAPYQGSAMVPYQQPGPLVPYQQPGPLLPYQQPGAMVPYQQPGPLLPYQQPGALVPFQQPGALVRFQPTGPLACYPAPAPAALGPYQSPGALVPHQAPGALVPYGQSLPWSPAPVPFVPRYALPLGAEGDAGVMLMSRGLQPSDFGLTPIADDPVLLRIWNDSLRDVSASTRSAATGGNGYQKYLAVLERGGPITQEMLEQAFGAVNKNFMPRARTAGYDIATVHHWNSPKWQYSEQVVDPRNLVPIPEPALLRGGYHPAHAGIHSMTGTGPSFQAPIDALHVIPIEDWAQLWTPPRTSTP